MSTVSKGLAESGGTVTEEVKKIADFILFIQRSVMLDLIPEQFNKAHISISQFLILLWIANEKKTPIMRDIAGKIGLTSGGMTELIDAIEKLGFVERIHSQEDRRNIMIRVTREGADFIAGIKQIICEKIQSMLDGEGVNAIEMNLIHQVNASLLARQANPKLPVSA